MPKRKKPNRRPVGRRRLRGRGGYWSDFQNWTKNTRGWGPQIMKGTSAFLDQIHPVLGGASRVARRMLGLGAYREIRQNTLLASPVPKMHDMFDTGIRICHDECIGEVNSTTSFTTTSYAINPGLATTFPWLASVARNFQEYEIHGLLFYFSSTSAEALNSTNTALGNVVGAFNYNVYKAPPVDLVQMLNMAGSVKGPPCVSAKYPLECEPSMRVFRNLLVRSNGVSDDLQKYDHANFTLATVGSQATAKIGTLHVTYDITLKMPVPGTIYAGLPSAKYLLTGTDSTHCLGTSQTKVYDTVGMSMPTAMKLAFPFGTYGAYRVSLFWVGDSTAVTLPTITPTNCTIPLSTYAPHAGGTSTQLFVEWVVAVTNTTSPTYVSFDGATLPANITYAQLEVAQINDAGITLGVPHVTPLLEEVKRVVEEEDDEYEEEDVPSSFPPCAVRVPGPRIDGRAKALLAPPHPGT